MRGFEVADEIVGVASDGACTAYTEQARLSPAVVERVFGEAPDSTWKFYCLDEILVETEEWRQEDDSVWFGVPPEDIDPLQSVLIGELGYDRPFALDFRGSLPVVRFMTADGRWVQVADSPSELLVALGIEREEPLA